MANKPVVAKLEVPAQAWLLYENMVIGDPDRSGNWRFFFREDGCFFQTRNEQLWLTEPAQFQSDDPALFWNTAWPATPVRCLTEAQRAELAEAINRTDFSALDPYYALPAADEVSSLTLERWTLVQEEQTYSVIVEDGSAPASLIELRTEIDRLVAEAPRS